MSTLDAAVAVFDSNGIKTSIDINTSANLFISFHQFGLS